MKVRITKQELKDIRTARNLLIMEKRISADQIKTINLLKASNEMNRNELSELIQLTGQMVDILYDKKYLLEGIELCDLVKKLTVVFDRCINET